MAAAGKLFSPESRSHTGVGIPEMNQKGETSTGYYINLRSGVIGKKISTPREL
jgi:hypothetical protein